MKVLVSLIHVVRQEIGRGRNLQRNITLGGTDNGLRSRPVLTWLMVLFAVFCLGGCIVTHSRQTRQTIELEVVKEFGFSVNEDGFVHPEISDITFVNNGSYITVPA